MVQATKWFYDTDGVWAYWKDPDTTKTYKDDLARYLGKDSAGAQITISTVVWTANGVTIVSNSNTTTILTVQVTKTGEAYATVTDSEGDIHQIPYRWKNKDRGNINQSGYG